MMLTTPAIHIRVASPHEDSLIATHFYQMWLDLDVPAQAIHADWLNLTLQFMEQARRDLFYAAFVAEVDAHVMVGSASCQLFAGLYPNILTANYRQYGYIWGVYVEPAYRRQGVARRLTEMAIAHLKSIGCTQAFLNASPMGKPVYHSLNFSQSNAMQLDLH